MSDESKETWTDLEVLLADKTELFLNDVAKIPEKEDLLKYIRIDLDPDSFLDYADAEMVLLITEIIRFLLGEDGAALPPTLREQTARWMFDWEEKDLQLAAKALMKIAQNGSEMDLVMESCNVTQWKGFIADRASWFHNKKKGVQNGEWK